MHLTPRQLADLRAEFAKGGLEATLLAAQFLEIIEKLQVQLRAAEAAVAGARRELAVNEAEMLERLLADAASRGDECSTCHDALARSLVARLRKLATDGEREAGRAQRVS
jgi:hypothetical protein